MTTDAQRQQYIQQIASASVPDVVDTSYQAQLASLGDYAQTAFNEVLAQYRFMGLVCGIKSESAGDTDQDVQDARDAIVEAISDFLNVEEGPIGSQIAQAFGEYQDMRDATDIYERFPGSHYEGMRVHELVTGIGTFGHPGDTASYAQEIVDGLRRPDLTQDLAQGRLSQAGADYVMEAAAKYEEAVRLDLIRRELNAERRRQWWNSVWDGVRAYYDENMELIRNGQWLLATGRIAIDAMIFAAEEIVITGLVVGIVAVTGGLAAGIMLALRAALRAALSVVRMGTRTVRRVNATWDFKIELRKVEPGILYSNPIPVNVTIGRKLDFEHRVDVANDLTPDERRALGEGGEGSTRPDADSGEGGDGSRDVDADGNPRRPMGPERDVECFPPPPNGTPEELAEFNRQLQEQQDTINNMTADDMAYAQTVLNQAQTRWREMGNSGSGTSLIRDPAAQRRARILHAANLRRQGLSRAQVNDIMANLDATHFLDIIAGGDPRRVGTGGSAANQRIGPTWARVNTPTGVSRSGQLGEIANSMRNANMSDHRMNVRLRSC